MNIAQTILFKYPDLDPRIDFMVTSRGPAENPIILEEWNTSKYPQPTQADLEQWEAERLAVLAVPKLIPIPTDTFIDTVFAPEAGDPPDHTWRRFSAVAKADPAIIQKLPKGGTIAGVRAEIEAISGFYLTHDKDFVPVDIPGTGSIITQVEYDRILALLDSHNY